MTRAGSSQDLAAPPALRLTFEAESLTLPHHPVALWRGPDGTVRARAFADGAVCAIDWIDLARFSFNRTSPAVRVAPAPGMTPDAVRREFAGTAEPLVLQAQGWHVLHASAARSHRGVMVFCGTSGAGKSTLAQALDRAGSRQCSDDLVVLDPRPGVPTVWTRPFTPSLRQPSIDYFGNRNVTARSQAGVRPEPLAGIVLLAPGDAPGVTRTRIDPHRAFARVLAHAHCFDHVSAEANESFLAFYLQLVERVPVFELQYRHEYGDLPEVVDTVLA